MPGCQIGQPWATTEQLVKNGALAPNLDKDARDQLAATSAQAQVAKAALGFTRLQSPITGTVQQRLAEPGEAVGPGIAVLLVEEVGRLVVRVGVSEEVRAILSRGMGVKLIPDGKDASAPGKISQVAPVPEVSDGLFSVEATPDASSTAQFVPGALVSVEFSDPKKPSVILLPLDALVERNQKKGVFVVGEGSGPARAVFREIKIQRMLGNEVSVVGGLSGGESVVAEGAYFLEDGEAVRPLTPVAAGHG
jgi:RND family efflux transporter MFP subunit